MGQARVYAGRTGYDLAYRCSEQHGKCIEIKRIPTNVNGPYRSLVEMTTAIPDIGKIHSDLAGFEYPCDGPDKPLCKEPLVLQVARQYDDDAAEVHHVVRKKDQRCCAWGTNSNGNAVVVSRKLNRYFSNKSPAADEVIWVNNVSPYPP